MNKDLLASSLHDLSEAIEQLAQIIAQQKDDDNDIHIQQFSLITKRFKESTQQLLLKSDVASIKKPKNINTLHKKGYIKNWLENNQIMVADGLDNLKADDYLYAAVDYLSDYYEYLLPFYKQLKSSQSVRKNFTHKTTKNSISYIQNWCKILQNLKLIDHYKIQNNESVFIDIAEVHNATYFIYGYWLEVLLRREIAQTLHKNLQQIHSFDIISQVSIVKPNQQLTELDLIIMVNEKIYWFECKSGIINNYFEKFAEHRKLMGLNEKNAFLLIPHKDANIALHTRRRSGMTALYGTELETKLSEILF